MIGTMGFIGAPISSAATHQKTTVEHIKTTVYPASKLGPDYIKHDAFTQTQFNLKEGETAVFTIKNYDSGSHSITATGLGLNIMIKGSTKHGVPSVTTYKFTPEKTGTFHLQGMIPCDGQAHGWAMTHDGYMAGTVK